jgi:hypothetical protein
VSKAWILDEDFHAAKGVTCGVLIWLYPIGWWRSSTQQPGPMRQAAGPFAWPGLTALCP